MFFLLLSLLLRLFWPICFRIVNPSVRQLYLCLFFDISLLEDNNISSCLKSSIHLCLKSSIHLGIKLSINLCLKSSIHHCLKSSIYLYLKAPIHLCLKFVNISLPMLVNLRRVTSCNSRFDMKQVRSSISPTNLVIKHDRYVCNASQYATYATNSWISYAHQH